MTSQEAQELMQDAWSLRREALEANPVRRHELLEQARAELQRAAEICRDQGVDLTHKFDDENMIMFN